MKSTPWTVEEAERHTLRIWQAYRENDPQMATLLYEATYRMTPEQWETFQQFFQEHEQDVYAVYFSRSLTIRHAYAVLELQQKVLNRFLRALRLCERCGIRLPAYQTHAIQSGRKSHKTLCPACAALIQGYQLPCLVCDTLFSPNVHNAKFCRACKGYQHEEQQVRYHNERARAANCAATLTLKEWLGVLEVFNWRCAYCQGPYETFEHFLPLTLSGSTSASNCIPSCKHCNAIKGKKHPLELPHIFPGERIARISTLLLLAAQQRPDRATFPPS